MDIELARTFLTIVQAGSFVAASHRLHVTQSTVSARIRTLEAALGKRLFERNNTSCELTGAGRRFHRYAESLLRVWEEARHQLAVPERFKDALAVGGQYSLFPGYLFDWLERCRSRMPDTALRVTAGMPRRLIAELLDGELDLVVVHSPELRPGLQVQMVFEDRLMMVTADPSVDFRSNYLFIDWGDRFRAMHAAALPEVHNPGITLEIGALATSMLLQQRGAGYLPERLASSLVRDGQLFRVPDAPVFLYPAFAVFPVETGRPSLDIARELLLDTARPLA